MILAETRVLVRKVDTLAGNVNDQVGPLSTDAQAVLVSAHTALAQVPALVQDVRRVVATIGGARRSTAHVVAEDVGRGRRHARGAQVTLAGVDGTLSADSALVSELSAAR